MKAYGKLSRWTAAFLATLLLVCCCSAGVYAVDDPESPIELTAPETVEPGDSVEIHVNARQAGITNGKLVIAYDSQILTYVSTATGEAWGEANEMEFADNAQTLGRLVLAFAGEEAAEAGEVFVLTFLVSGTGEAEVRLEDGSRLPDLGDTPVIGAVTIVSDDGSAGPGDDRPTPPDIPLPEEPIRPSTPPSTPGTTDDDTDEPEEPEEPGCDGGVDCPSRNFTDVNDEWFHLDVDYVVSHGLMMGTSATTFSPDMVMDRAQMVTILYRMAGSPAVQGAVTFDDVPAGSYYEIPVQWAAENGITMGTGEGKFSPLMTLTREQIATFLYRYAAFLGRDVSARADLSRFTDAAAISDYAVEAVSWAVAEGIIQGSTNGQLEPKAPALRSQMAAMIHRFDTAGQA